MHNLPRPSFSATTYVLVEICISKIKTVVPSGEKCPIRAWSISDPTFFALTYCTCQLRSTCWVNPKKSSIRTRIYTRRYFPQDNHIKPYLLFVLHNGAMKMCSFSAAEIHHQHYLHECCETQLKMLKPNSIWTVGDFHTSVFRIARWKQQVKNGEPKYQKMLTCGDKEMYGKAAIEARALPPSLLTKLLRTENHPL